MSKTLMEPSIEYLPPLQSLPPLDIFNSPPELPEHQLERTPSAPSISSFTPSQTNSFQSKYSKASYSLTNHPDAIKLYRSMAIKTKDPVVQLTYAKYLLEIAHLYPQRQSSRMDRSNAEPIEDETRQKRLREEGVRWIRRLAGQGIGEAAYLLGSWLESGLYGFKRSPAKALRFYELAAKERVPRAMFAVAQYHEREQDYMTSFQLYEDAASLGLADALYRIAMIHLKGEFGSRQNPKAAIQLLVKACERPEPCAEASYTLGLLLLNDYPQVNIPNDLIEEYGGPFEAMNYIEYASDSLSDAQYKLGEIYEQGKYNVVDIFRAYQYYEMAAKDHPWAMLALSRIFNQGIQVPPEQAEEQRILFDRDDSHWIKTHPRDEDSAFRWCRQAADQEIAEAYYLLGWYYEIGIGILRDYKQALYYYQKATKSNHAFAKERALLLEKTVKKKQNKSKGSTQCLVM
ncbi:unnamed protein product [Rhizopus stolonifer]